MAEAALASAPPSPARLPSKCVGASPALQKELAALFVREVQDGDLGLLVHVDFPCVEVGAEPGSVVALVVSGHGGTARVVGIRASGPGTFGARVLRVLTGGGSNQTPAGTVEFFRRDVSGASVARLFDRMRTAVAARITTERKVPDSADQIALGSFGISSNDTSMELALRDERGGVYARGWEGYGGSIGAESRVPMELAWRALGEVALEGSPSTRAEPEDRVLLREAWLQSIPDFERPWYATRALLLFAAHAGSAELIPSIVKQLDATDADTQQLAVDALAAISGHDVRRDESGNARALSDVVAEYRRECVLPPRR
jgi:hypothetical protein